jgi:hypothetical protein
MARIPHCRHARGVPREERTDDRAPSPACEGGLGWGCFHVGIPCVERAPTRRALRARRPPPHPPSPEGGLRRTRAGEAKKASAVRTPSQLSINVRTDPPSPTLMIGAHFPFPANQPRDPCPHARSSDLRAQAARDVAGSRDYPGIGRFGGSVISGYQVKDFDAARMQGAAFKDGKPTDARRLEGASSALPIAAIPAPRSSKCRAISRRNWRRPDSKPCSPATPTPAAAFPSRKHSTRCRSRKCGSTGSITDILPGARSRAAARRLRASWSARTTATSMRSLSSPN